MYNKLGLKPNDIVINSNGVMGVIFQEEIYEEDETVRVRFPEERTNYMLRIDDLRHPVKSEIDEWVKCLAIRKLKDTHCDDSIEILESYYK